MVGAGARAFDLAVLLRREGGRLAYDLTFVHDPAVMGPVDPRLAADPACRVLPAAEGFLAAARACDAEQIVVAADDRRGLPMRALLTCRTAGFPVLEYMPFLEREIRRVDVKRLELGWLLYSEGFTSGPLDRALKRAMDVVAGAVLLAATLPLLAATALAVKLEDGGPVLYAQSRVTRGGRVSSATMRPQVSVPPPAAKGTMNRTGRSGKAPWARPMAGAARATAPAAARRPAKARRFMGLSLSRRAALPAASTRRRGAH